MKSVKTYQYHYRLRDCCYKQKVIKITNVQLTDVKIRTQSIGKVFSAFLELR